MTGLMEIAATVNCPAGGSNSKNKSIVFVMAMCATAIALSAGVQALDKAPITSRIGSGASWC